MARNPKPVRRSYRCHPREWRKALRRAIEIASEWGLEAEVIESFHRHRSDNRTPPYACAHWALYDWDI